MSVAAKTNQSGFAFDTANLAKAEEVIGRYPTGRQASAVMPLLDLAQRQNGGWLNQAAMDYVAAFLGMPPVRVYEVASFYTMYNLKPVGRHHVQVCTNISCWLRGSDEILDACHRTLGTTTGQTTDDQTFTVTEVECLGACVNAPVVQVGDTYYEDLTPQAMTQVLDTLRAGEVPKAGSQIGRVSCEPVGGLTSLTSTPAAQRFLHRKGEGAS